MRINWSLKTTCPIGHRNKLPDTEFTAKVYASTAAIEPPIWDALATQTHTTQKAGPSINPFLRHAFFLALETSHSAVPETGWQPQHILIFQGDKPVGLLPLFLKSHSQGEYVFDHGWAQAYEQAGGHYYPKLQSSVPFTPVTTPKLLAPSGNIAHRLALLDTAEQLVNHLGASSVHATFITADEEILVQETPNWIIRHDTQFHWKNKDFSSFADFTATLSSRKRKTIRKERENALSTGLTVQWIKGKDIVEDHWDRFFEFYQDTGARKWGQPYLTRQFFSLLSQHMPESLVLMFAMDGDIPIAGTLNFISNDTLYGRYWGCSRDVPFLHFELCYYQAIDYAIDYGLKTVEAGAQGPHKLARGYEATLTRSIHYLRDPGLHEAVKNYLELERNAVARDKTQLDLAAPFKKQ